MPYLSAGGVAYSTPEQAGSASAREALKPAGGYGLAGPPPGTSPIMGPGMGGNFIGDTSNINYSAGWSGPDPMAYNNAYNTGLPMSQGGGTVSYGFGIGPGKPVPVSSGYAQPPPENPFGGWRDVGARASAQDVIMAAQEANQLSTQYRQYGGYPAAQGAYMRGGPDSAQMTTVTRQSPHQLAAEGYYKRELSRMPTGKYAVAVFGAFGATEPVEFFSSPFRKGGLTGEVAKTYAANYSPFEYAVRGLSESTPGKAIQAVSVGKVFTSLLSAAPVAASEAVSFFGASKYVSAVTGVATGLVTGGIATGYGFAWAAGKGTEVGTYVKARDYPRAFFTAAEAVGEAKLFEFGAKSPLGILKAKPLIIEAIAIKKNVVDSGPVDAVQADIFSVRQGRKVVKGASFTRFIPINEEGTPSQNVALSDIVTGEGIVVNKYAAVSLNRLARAGGNTVFIQNEAFFRGKGIMIENPSYVKQVSKTVKLEEPNFLERIQFAFSEKYEPMFKTKKTNLIEAYAEKYPENPLRIEIRKNVINPDTGKLVSFRTKGMASTELVDVQGEPTWGARIQIRSDLPKTKFGSLVETVRTFPEAYKNPDTYFALAKSVLAGEPTGRFRVIPTMKEVTSHELFHLLQPNRLLKEDFITPRLETTYRTHKNIVSEISQYKKAGRMGAEIQTRVFHSTQPFEFLTTEMVPDKMPSIPRLGNKQTTAKASFVSGMKESQGNVFDVSVGIFKTDRGGFGTISSAVKNVGDFGRVQGAEGGYQSTGLAHKPTADISISPAIGNILMEANKPPMVFSMLPTSTSRKDAGVAVVASPARQESVRPAMIPAFTATKSSQALIPALSETRKTPQVSFISEQSRAMARSSATGTIMTSDQSMKTGSAQISMNALSLEGSQAQKSALVSMSATAQKSAGGFSFKAPTETLFIAPPKNAFGGMKNPFLPKQKRRPPSAKGRIKKTQVPYSDLGSINASVFKFGTAHPGADLKRIAATSATSGVFGRYPTFEQSARMPRAQARKKRWGLF